MQSTNIYRVIEEMATTNYPSKGHQPFVYAILFETGEFYIGCKYSKRYGAHPSMLITGEYNSSSSTVQERVAAEPHQRYIIGIGTAEEVTALERDITRSFWDVDGRLNSRIPNGVVVSRHTQETKDKIGKASKGKKLSQEHKDKLSKAHKGRIVSQETRDKIGKAQEAIYKRDWPQERIDQLLSLREQGLSFTAIGRELGCSWATARNNYNRHKK